MKFGAINAIGEGIIGESTDLSGDGTAVAIKVHVWRILIMSAQSFKSRNSAAFSAVRGIGLSLGVAVLLVGSGAGAATSSTDSEVLIAQYAPIRSNVRVPPSDSPQSADDPYGGNDGTQTAEGPRFTCEYVGGQYTVMYHPQSQEGLAYAWATPTALGGGWTPEARCNEISRRLEAYRPDGLQELRTAVENNYNTICVTTQENPACRIVLTVPPGQDPRAIRDRVFQNLTVADSGRQTDAVTTLMGNGQEGKLLEQILGTGASTLGGRSNRQSAPDGINLRPFLDAADGGTGAKLRGGGGGVRNDSSPRLNPDIFR